MNILAHLYLSGDEEGVILGNFIGDFVKGKQILNFNENIAKGIKIHREIDHFTDQHKNVKKVNSIFRKKYGKHAGIVTDIIFDHYLSNNWELFSDIKYEKFIKSRYHILTRNIKMMPFKVAEFYPFMVINDWLKLYKSVEGIERVLKGMSKRTTLPAEYIFASNQLRDNYKTIDDLFIPFFYEIIDHILVNFNLQLNLPERS